VRTIGRLNAIETVCLRVFNAYGPGQHLPPVHAPVIPYFLRQAQQNGTIVIHGDGSQTRDYVYVDDVVSAMVAAAIAPDVNERIINIGSGTETSVRQLVDLVLEATGYQANSAVQPASALLGIRLVIGPIPAILLIIGILFAWLYPLSRDQHAAIVRELEARRASK